ncbi:Staufen [Operophtera brumata]|uniref:Staufen n=1 Tax=Operophtera brumata TaxID=104452 RepID=A0A0L7LPF9_OPEBR|nr:Staufen [Operophtera brumata]
MPTVELNALAMKLCQPAVYTSVPPVPLAVSVPGMVRGRSWVGFPRLAGPALVSDPLSSEVKSPVSLVHELALKRNLTVIFTVKSERGPPHMRVFITICTVGDMETEGEGNGKKVSKRRAAEKMLEEMRTRWPPAMLRPRPALDKRRHQPTKKKPRNLIKCVAPPHAATGLGPNKKAAKRRAAHNVLLAMEINSNAPEPVPVLAATKEPMGNGTSGGTVAAAGGSSPGAKDQLMYLAHLLGFTVQFSDFPKRNHGEYLSLVSLSTEPPVMCHGGGPSTAHSHEQCSRAALRALALMGLDTARAPRCAPWRSWCSTREYLSLSTEPPVMCHGGGPSTAHSHEQCSRAALLMGLDT